MDSDAIKHGNIIIGINWPLQAHFSIQMTLPLGRVRPSDKVFPHKGQTWYTHELLFLPRQDSPITEGRTTDFTLWKKELLCLHYVSTLHYRKPRVDL